MFTEFVSHLSKVGAACSYRSRPIVTSFFLVLQGSHTGLEKYLNLEGFLEKSLKIKFALKSTGKSLKGLEKSLISTIFCST